MTRLDNHKPHHCKFNLKSSASSASSPSPSALRFYLSSRRTWPNDWNRTHSPCIASDWRNILRDNTSNVYIPTPCGDLLLSFGYCITDTLHYMASIQGRVLHCSRYCCCCCRCRRLPSSRDGHTEDGGMRNSCNLGPRNCPGRKAPLVGRGSSSANMLDPYLLKRNNRTSRSNSRIRLLQDS